MRSGLIPLRIEVAAPAADRRPGGKGNLKRDNANLTGQCGDQFVEVDTVNQCRSHGCLFFGGRTEVQAS
jgi:hypothetical protein